VLLLNKNVLITGGSSGIGKSIAIHSLNQGGNVFITGRNLSKLERVKDDLGKSGESELQIFQFDQTNILGIEQFVSKLPNLDSIVFSAGMLEYCPVKYISFEKIEQMFTTNLFSNIIFVRELIKQRKINSFASIIFIGSISSKKGIIGTALYAASKAALASFAKVLASELANKKIRVNTLSVGLVNTELTSDSGIGQITNSKSESDRYLLGIGNVDDVSHQVLFLLSDNSKWITGSDLVIDGGFLIT
jgi:NAD(P)-dependent dehydrogenase (short-subunit alcohol dehydrogenase family)